MFANEDLGLSCVWTQMIYLLCVGCKVHCPRQVKILPISAQGHNWLVR